MSFFSSIGHFFAHLFGASSNEAQTVLTDVSKYVTLAEPIVAEVETIIKAAPQSATAIAVEKFLSKYEPDLAKAAAMAGELAKLPSADLWHNAAVLALQTLVPQAGVAASLLNLAVELAYNIFKQKAAQTPKAAQVLTKLRKVCYARFGTRRGGRCFCMLTLQIVGAAGGALLALIQLAGVFLQNRLRADIAELKAQLADSRAKDKEELREWVDEEFVRRRELDLLKKAA